MEIKGPIRAINYPHKAIRCELNNLVDLAESATIDTNFNEMEQRVSLLSDFVGFHAEAEEDYVYPALNDLHENIADSYSWDHKVDEEYFGNIKLTLQKLRAGGQAEDLVNLRRNVIALRTLLHAHSKKEDDLLIPIIDTEISPPDQGAMLGKISSKIPPEFMKSSIPFLFGNLTTDERVDYLGIMRNGMPPENFDMMMGWLGEALPSSDMEEIRHQLV